MKKSQSPPSSSSSFANPKPSKPTSVLPYKTQNLRNLYLIGKKLGQGQFGTTYLCTEKSTGNLYACKSIPKRKLICKEDFEDVWREIQIMHHLSEHPNVVRIKGAYEDSVFVHLVMELCAGGELFDRIVMKGHFSERKAAHLIKTIVSVVEGCHSLGVMHRDLKPENFLFISEEEDSALKATDFGLSVFYKPGWWLGLCQMRVPAGHTAFMIRQVPSSAGPHVQERNELYQWLYSLYRWRLADERIGLIFVFGQGMYMRWPA